jgi:putative membrane protein
MPVSSAKRPPWALLAGVLVALAASGVGPYDRFTWMLEIAPILLALPVLVLTWRRFPLTTLAYVLVALHAVVLLVGGHWSYARVPLGEWMRDAFHLARNPYDRIGHLMQGFAPAIVAREVLLRTSPLRPGRWLAVIVVSICLAISSIYEMIEWWTAVLSGDSSVAFLGTQGDPWDTQWDMFLCGVGAVAALLLLSRWHDRQLARL